MRARGRRERIPRYRHALPKPGGELFLTDAGLETDLIFSHGIEIREFAAHTLLPDPTGRAAPDRHFPGFRLPWINIFGLCCGADLRHVREIAKALPRPGGG